MMTQRGGNKIAAEVWAEGGDSDNSDTDEDPDKEAVKSVLFMQDKRKKATQSNTSDGSRKRPAEASSMPNSKMEGTSSEAAKKPKLAEELISEDVIDSEISEEFVRRLLEKKPHSTKQLLGKVGQRIQQKQQHGIVTQGKDKRIVTRLADILKRIEPYQFRRKNEAGKEVLYFSLNRTA